MSLLIHEDVTGTCRDNVVWMSPDGTWNRAVFAMYVPDSGELIPYPGGVHPGMDRFVDYEHFQWCSTGHQNMGDALASWAGRPLSHTQIIDSVAILHSQRLDTMVERWRTGTST